MSKRDPVEKKQRRAADIVRRLESVARMNGVLWVEPGGLWLLGRPAERSSQPQRLAGVLLAPELPDRAALAELLGARESVPLEPQQLARWSKHLAELEASRDLEELLTEGVRPLRSYRGTDVAGRIEAARARLERLSRLHTGLATALSCLAATEDEPSPETLVGSLPLRMTALGNWTHDPVPLLLRRSLPADAALLRLARNEDEPSALLAALILGARHKRRPSPETEAVAHTLPLRTRPAYRAGLSGDVSCLAAFCLAEGLPPGPSVAGLEREDGERLVRAGERLAALFGPAAATTALASLARPFRDLGRAAQRLQRFEELARLAERGVEAGHGSEEATLLADLRRLCQPDADAARGLADCLRRWMGDPGPLGTRPLVRRARAALSHGLARAARELATAWLEGLRKAGTGDRASPSLQRARLALHLHFPHARFEVPDRLDERHVDFLADALGELPASRVEELAPCLPLLEAKWRGDSSNPSSFLRRFLQSSVPVGLLRRVLDRGLWIWAEPLADHPDALARYLDCRDALGYPQLAGFDPDAGWFVELFRTNRPWTTAVTLVLLGQARPRASAADGAVALVGLARELAGLGPLAIQGDQLARALDAWATPVLVNPPPELGPLGDRLLERSSLAEYLHHRRLAGEGETFALALLEPLHLQEREQAEADYLRRRLAQSDIADRQRGHLETRLARLTDPELRADRLNLADGRALNRMHRSLPLLRQASLDRVLDDLYRTHVARLLGKTLPPGPLPPGLREALQLVAAENLDLRLFASFLDDILAGRPLRERPENRAWLERAQRAGIDVKAWLGGFQATLTICGEPITFATEKDPLHVLKMGSYFDTCLSLGTGSNAASTLVNAMDVNKQVIYGRRQDGAVVARKLIGATLGRELAGYNTYSAAHSVEVRYALGTALTDFARRCNLRPGNDATPEQLHQGFWYNDGNESWPPPAQTEPPPPGLPADDEAAREWEIDQGLRFGRLELLRQAALLGQGEQRVAALFHLLGHSPQAAAELPADFDQGVVRDALRWLAARDGLAWSPALAGRVPRGDLEGLAQLLGLHALLAPGSTPGAFRQGLHAFAPAFADPSEPRTARDCLRASPLLTGLPPDLLPEYVRTVAGSAPADDSVEAHAVIRDWAGLLHLGWLRDPRPRPLVAALRADHPWLAPMVVELARRQRIPGLAPALRKRLSRAGSDEDRGALALGTQGEAADGPRLLALLRQRPWSLRLAVAVVRSGDEAAAAEARRLWRPPASLDRPLADPHWLAMARELQSPALAHRLARLLRHGLLDDADEASDRDRTGSLRATLWGLGHLALPGDSGDADRVFAALPPAVDPARHIHRSDRDRPRRLRGLLLNWASVPERLARGGPAALEAVAWWREVSLLCADAVAFHDDAVEAGLVRLLVQGTTDEKVAVIEARLEVLRPDGRKDFLQELGALLGDERFRLPLDLRSRIARTVIEAGVSQFSPSEMATLLAWLETLAAEDQGEALGAMKVGVFGYWEHAPPYFLLGLEGPDERRRQATLAFLARLAQVDPRALLALMHQAFLWLTPQAAEDAAVQLLPGLPVAERPQELAEGLCNLSAAAASYRLQRLFAERVAPQLEPWVRARVIEFVRGRPPSPRRDWLAGLIEASAPG